MTFLKYGRSFKRRARFEHKHFHINSCSNRHQPTSTATIKIASNGCTVKVSHHINLSPFHNKSHTIHAAFHTLFCAFNHRYQASPRRSFPSTVGRFLLSMIRGRRATGQHVKGAPLIALALIDRNMTYEAFSNCLTCGPLGAFRSNSSRAVPHPQAPIAPTMQLASTQFSNLWSPH
jgi:hypothetical protein